MHILKRVRRYILLLLLLLIVTVELPIIAVGQSTQPSPSDTLIVLGAKLIGSEPSTMLRLRLEQAVKLYSAGYAGKIIVSGGQGADEACSEAKAMYDYLVNHGIPADSIFLEDQSVNTYQNLAFSQKIMQQQGWETAIIVSNASHIRRSLLLAGSLHMSACGAPAPMADNYYLTAKQYMREGVATVALLLMQ